MRDIDHFIVGGAGGQASRFGDVFDPNSGQVQARVPLGTAETLDRAIAAAQKSQPGWAATNADWQDEAGVTSNEKGGRVYTIAWVEEAATVSQSSIDALIPTIRQAVSEIWWTYNPRFETDPVDQLFRGNLIPPPGSIVVEVQWYDNKWFPDVLARDMEYDQRRDPISICTFGSGDTSATAKPRFSELDLDLVRDA